MMKVVLNTQSLIMTEMNPATSEVRPAEDLANPSRPDEKLYELVLFKCANGACELEFPIFAKDSMFVVYCPRCSGMVVKKVGILSIRTSPSGIQ